MTSRLAKHALAVYVFLPAVGPDRERAYEQLLRMWSACGERLGLRDAITSLELPAELPVSSAPVDDPGPLAARQRVGSGVEQAFVLREHDVYCLVVMLAPQPSAGVGWRQLDERWSAAMEQAAPGPLLGQTLLYLALLSRQHDPLSAVAEVRAAMPAARAARPRWWRHPSTVRQGFTIWEASSAEDARSERRIAVVTDEHREAALDEWVWTRGDPVLPPLGRYLLHAAKVRYELRVHAGGRQIRQLRNEADAQVEDLLGLLAREGGPVQESTVQDSAGQDSDESLIAASARLLAVQAGSAGLVHTATRLSEMRRTVQIAAANMAAVLRPDSPQTGPLAQDRALADWFAQQLDDDSLYVQAARERTRDVAAVTATVVQHRLQQRQDAARQRQERFNLLQTAIIGAVIMGLTAVQALGYQLPLPGPVKPPVIAALGAITLLLASIVVRLTLSSGRQPLAWLSYLATGLTVAAFAWLGIAWFAHAALHRLAAPDTTAMLATIGFAAGVAGAYAASAHRSSRGSG